MTTNARTQNPSTHDSAHQDAERIPDAHAVESRTLSAGAGHAPSPAVARLLHPLRPATRRPVRDPHEPAARPAERTTAAAPAPSTARPPREVPPVTRTRGVVPPTVLPAPSGDLLGLPDLGALRAAVRRAWTRLVREVRAAAELDARLRSRRDEDVAAMARAGGYPSRLI